MTKKKTIAIICTGNTCRSPMAEGWLRAELRRRGLDKEFDVVSCGIFARKGSSASFEADMVLQNEELNLADFRSQPITREIIEDAAKIFVMSEEHRDSIVDLVPDAADRMRVLGIDDPIGRDMWFYKECFEKIKKAIQENWSWLVE